MRQIFETKSGRIALGGILAAGSIAIMMFACILPASRTGLVAISGLFPMVGVLIGSRMVGYLCWFSTGVLGIFLLPDKGCALLYLLFFGLYPVLKSQIESIRKFVLEWILKLLFFNFVFLFVWFTFQNLFLAQGVTGGEIQLPVLILMGEVMFVCYDFLLSHIVALLRKRLERK